ncbi:hypothetical protein KR074_002320, partial [Drosophila pseudoananassae]
AMDPRVIVVILSVLFLSDLISAEEEYLKNPSTEQNIEGVESSGTCFEVVKPVVEYFQELKTDADKGNEFKYQLMEVLKEVEIKDQLITSLNATIKSKDERIQTCLDNVIKNNRTLIEKDKEIQEKTDQANIKDAQNSLLTSRINDISQNLTKANKRLLECVEINSCTAAEKGIYNIKLPGMSAFKAPCNGSGWTVIQRRMDGSVDFNRSWNEYRDGFGDLKGEFFIGLEKLHQITQSKQYELFISLGEVDGSRYFAKYDNFKVGSEKNSYPLESVGNYTGNAGDYLSNLNRKFSTYDRDNDLLWDGSCATEHGGGWWFGYCGYSSLNGRFYKDGKIKDKLYGIGWGMWLKYHYTVSLTFVEMMIRPKT